MHGGQIQPVTTHLGVNIREFILYNNNMVAILTFLILLVSFVI